MLKRKRSDNILASRNPNSCKNDVGAILGEKRLRVRRSKNIILRIPNGLVLKYPSILNRSDTKLCDALAQTKKNHPFILIFRSLYSLRDNELDLKQIAETFGFSMPVINVLPEEAPNDVCMESTNENENYLDNIHTVYDPKGLLARECRVLDPIGGGEQSVDCLVIVDGDLNRLGVVLLEKKSFTTVIRNINSILF